MVKFFSKNFSQTKKLGANLARKILKIDKKKKVIFLALIGDLGGGKTTFLQGFARGLGIKERILSPTFVIIKKFPIPNSQFSYFYHFDCYRIKNSKEILALGFKEIISNPKNIVAIEWPEKIKKIIPKDSIWINFEFINIKERRISIKSQIQGIV